MFIKINNADISFLGEKASYPFFLSNPFFIFLLKVCHVSDPDWKRHGFAKVSFLLQYFILILAFYAGQDLSFVIFHIQQVLRLCLWMKSTEHIFVKSCIRFDTDSILHTIHVDICVKIFAAILKLSTIAKLYINHRLSYAVIPCRVATIVTIVQLRNTLKPFYIHN